MIPSEIANVGVYLWIDSVSFSYQVPLIEDMKEFNHLKKIIVIDYSCNQNLETRSKILTGKKKDYVFLPWQEIDQLKINKDTYLFFSKPYLETYKDLDFEKLLFLKKFIWVIQYFGLMMKDYTLS